MQAQTRTPNSILRKRLNKENEDATARIAKRNKLANRRVSFAPDEELETKHIFKEDSRDDRNSTGDLRLGSPVDKLATGAGAIDSQELMAPPQYLMQQPGGPLAVPPSPGGLSPLSMDLTNNSLDQQGQAVALMPGGFNPRRGDGLAGAVLPPVQHRHQQAEYTRNITMNVPNLSTLVEEDEEEYAAADGTGGGGADTGTSASPRALESPGMALGLRPGDGGDGHVPPVSPISPFVLREMQRGQPSGDGDEEVRNRWGFMPGAEDTLEVSFGRAVMGETTYNHVYGAASTGDLTKAIKDGQTGGNQLGPGAVTRALATMAAARGPTSLGDDGGADAVAAAVGRPSGALASAALLRPEVGLGPSVGAVPPQTARQAAMQQQLPAQSLAQNRTQALELPLGLGPQMLPPPASLPHNTPYMDNTTKLLEIDQTDAWRMPGYDRGRLSVASNKVMPPGYRRGPPAGASRGAGGETTMLLGTTTQLLATGNTTTAQLLPDTTDHKAAYERFLRNAPARQAPPSAAPVARPGMHPGPGEATAVSSSAAELRRLAAQDNTNMSLELQGTDGSGTSNDLLGDNGGLLLDSFALPPEPTVNLAAQHAQAQAQGQRQPQGEREGALGQAAGGLLLGRSAGAYAAALAPAPALRPSLPKITCQDFLSLIDVSFNDKVCRSSYLPQSDPPPKTVAEIYEAAVTTAPHVDVYNEMQIEVGGRLANMQSRVQQLETELTSSNPEFFSAVQLAPPAQLETIKEQFISLKKLCRIRTVKVIKQTHLNALDKLISRLDTSKAQLQAEVAAMMADMERFNCCLQDKNALTAAITRRCQEDEERMQESIQRKKAVEGHLQRLEALRAQNAQRQRRIEEAQAERRAVEQNRVPKEALAQERSVLEARSASLVTRACSSALTPGREGQLARQVAMKREEVEALLGLHALRIDLMGMEDTGKFTLLFKGTYQVACTKAGSVCKIDVAGPVEAAQLGSLAPSIVAELRSTAAALSCRIPRAQLALRLEAIVQHLQRMWRLAQQLEACWLKHNCMQKPLVEERGFDGRPALLLQFLNADTVTKVSIRMPWQAALHSDFVSPSLRVQMHSLESEETQQQYCDALHDTVLSKLAPNAGLLSALCFAMSVTLQVPSEVAQSAGSDSSGDTGNLNRTPLPLPRGEEGVGRVFDNPLFTSPTVEVGRA